MATTHQRERLKKSLKRAVILHGTDANPAANWFPWLRERLEKNKNEVLDAPELVMC